MTSPAVALKDGRFQSFLDPLGWMLHSFHAELAREPVGLQPRWVRIAAGRTHGVDKGLGHVLRFAVEQMLGLASLCHELVFTLTDAFTSLEEQRAGVKRIFEELRSALSASNLGALSTALPSLSKVAQTTGDVLDVMERGIDLWPDETDLLMLGHHIYKLLAIKPNTRPTGLMSATPPPAVDLSGTGPLRLLQWAYEADYTVRGLGPIERPESGKARVCRLGSRWLWETENQKLPPVSRATWAWAGAGSRTEAVYEHLFNEAEPDALRRTRDLQDLHLLLEELGYFAGPVRPDLRHSWHPALSQAVEAFQAINQLPRTRELDASTLNRLLHLDVEGQTVKRALPLDPKLWARVPTPPPLPPLEIIIEKRKEIPVTVPGSGVKGQVSGHLPLVNPDANTPADEGLVVEHASTGRQDVSTPQLSAGTTYRYYRCGRAPSGGKVPFDELIPRGWIQHAGEADPVEGRPLQPGFTAIESRVWREEARAYDGGDRSEGATGNGPFFFAARHQAPAIAGRQGDANPPLWQPGRLEAGARTGLYQWVDLGPLWSLCTVGEVVELVGTATMRVRLPRDGATASGRLALAIVDRESWKTAGYGTVFDRSKITAASGQPLVTSTGWFPTDERVAIWRKKLSDGTANMKSTLDDHWIAMNTEPLRVLVTNPAPVLYVGLHGQSPGGQDLDAYFDMVGVRWERAAGAGSHAATVSASNAASGTLADLLLNQEMMEWFKANRPSGDTTSTTPAPTPTGETGTTTPAPTGTGGEDA